MNIYVVYHVVFSKWVWRYVYHDIYPHVDSSKYKTLIRVILKPSKTYDVKYIDDTSMYQNDVINKLSHNEWN